MDSGVWMGLGIFAALFAFGWAYYTIKQNVKRNILFKNQYEQQKLLTHQNRIFITNTTVEQVKRSLARHIHIDDSVKGAFVGGKYQITKQTDNYIEYKHTSSFMVGGDGDEFTASVSFNATGSELRAVFGINSWHEKDGVTRRAGIEAMRELLKAVESAFKAVDLNVRISTVQK